MKKVPYILGILFSLCIYSTVFAADIISPSQDQQNVIVPQEQTHKNLYISGDNVIIRGNTQGDLVAAGGTVINEGIVDQDAFIAGGNVTSNGAVKSNARLSGGSVTINGPVTGDLLAAGGTVTISESSSVGGDALFAGGNVSVEAPIKGYLKIAGGAVYINSKIDGNVTVMSSKKLVFGPNSEITGSIVYKGAQPAEVRAGAKISQIQFTRVEYKGFRKGLAGILTLVFLIKLLALIVAGLILLRLIKNFFFTTVQDLQAKPWSALGLGVLALIGVPFVVLVLLATFIGYYIGGVLFLLYILLLLSANVVGALFVGTQAIKYLTKPTDVTPDWQIVVIGVVVWELIKFIPIFGTIITILIFLAVLGSMLRVLRQIIFKPTA